MLTVLIKSNNLTEIGGKRMSKIVLTSCVIIDNELKKQIL